MKNIYTYQYKAEQWLPVDINTAWDFFSSPLNLSLITPPQLDFRILTQPIIERIYEGMLINYSVKPLFGISVKWTTEIIDVCENNYFTDRQLKGPYKVWEHTHYFRQKDNGVQMTDVIKYQIPYSVLGMIIHRLIIRSKIESIFEYRKNKLKNIFG